LLSIRNKSNFSLSRRSILAFDNTCDKNDLKIIARLIAHMLLSNRLDIVDIL